MRIGGRFRNYRASAPWIALTVLFWAPTAFAGGTLESIGDVGQFAIPAAAAAVSAVKGDGQGLLQLGVSAAVTFGTAEGLKYAVDKKRPDGGNHAFPSGHTARAFAGASYLHYRYGWQWGLPSYLAAGVVGYSRIEAHEHDWVDVVAGAAIANAIGFVLVDSADSDVVIVPVIDTRKKNFGILASFRF